MEEIYVNVSHLDSDDKITSRKQTGPRSSESRFHGAVVLCLGLLSVFLLAGLIGLAVHLRRSAAELSTIKANLTERLQDSINHISSMTKERDLLNTSLIQLTEETNRLKSLSKQKKSCPAGWTMFRCSCYLLSTQAGSWDKGRQDCRDREAELVTIDSYEEQVPGAQRADFMELLFSVWGCSVFSCWLDSSASLSTIITPCSVQLQKSLLSLFEERDLLKTISKHMENNLTELRAQLTAMTEKSDWPKSCPAGWRMFRCAFYFLSTVSDSWEKGRQDCRNRGADLVVIDSADEQMFLSNFTKKGTLAWIGLTDKGEEGAWKWINEAPLTLKFWRPPQPDNGGGMLGEEDCAHITITGNDFNNWNDLACDTRLRWICEKGFNAEP
ncbi:CD209 antigen-like protein A isoform X2 [Mastacembelus armatus]|uniref:CD209 antigen-like protein A isoform X2 n=1 Tax=Mastacembelus armatus TaxID=205130 RepID=UPI000E456319|nr:CD209 antigen-like protein A isoform X2 [Mastacembelus armatus]